MTNRGNGRRRGRTRGFTLIELLVVIAILSLLVTILLPSLAKAKDLAREAVCASNLRNLGMGHFLYAAEFDGWAVPNVMWNDFINFFDGSGLWLAFPQLGINWDPMGATLTPDKVFNYRVLVCPSDRMISAWNGSAHVQHGSPPDLDPTVHANGIHWNQSYALNANYENRRRIFALGNKYIGPTHGKEGFWKYEDIVRAGEIIYWADNVDYRFASNSFASWLNGVLGETQCGTVFSPDSFKIRSDVGCRHRDGPNCLFFDGHVSWEDYWMLVDMGDWSYENSYWREEY